MQIMLAFKWSEHGHMLHAKKIIFNEKYTHIYCDVINVLVESNNYAKTSLQDCTYIVNILITCSCSVL